MLFYVLQSFEGFLETSHTNVLSSLHILFFIYEFYLKVLSDYGSLCSPDRCFFGKVGHYSASPESAVYHKSIIQFERHLLLLASIFFRLRLVFVIFVWTICGHFWLWYFFCLKLVFVIFVWTICGHPASWAWFVLTNCPCPLSPPFSLHCTHITHSAQ